MCVVLIHCVGLNCTLFCIYLHDYEDLWDYSCAVYVVCVAGLGLGMIYLPSIVMVSQYFSKRRALATGIAVCGSGVGTFIFAPLTNALLAQFAWKGTVLIDAAILLNCIPCGLIFRPLLKSSRKTKKDSSPGNALEQGESMSQNSRREICVSAFCALLVGFAFILRLLKVCSIQW